MKYSEGLEFGSSGDGTCFVRSIGACVDINIVIPPVSPVGDHVVRIGSSAFSGCNNMLSVVVPGSVEEIGNCAFWGCKSLVTVVIENGTKIIENYAFGYCAKLSSVEIPSSVKLLGRGAFESCYHLKNITIPNSVSSISSHLFTGCYNLESINVGNNITYFNRGAFYDCQNLISGKNNYKAFAIRNSNLECRDKKYKIGKKSSCKGDLIPCENGIHYCTNIFDIFNYYYGEYGKDFVIGVCDVSDKNVGCEQDSKRCARWIIPKKILTREEVINIMSVGDISE